MNYELAKKLKNAGFPFQECKLESCNYVGDSLDESGKNYHYPTLEELIEACGEHFEKLKAFGSKENNSWRWEASGIKENIGIYKTAPTHLEAVANLWLALQNNPPLQ